MTAKNVLQNPLAITMPANQSITKKKDAIDFITNAL